MTNMIIFRGTTPIIQYAFKTMLTSQIQTAYMTVKQGGGLIVELSLAEAEVGEKTLSWTLTQEDTLKLRDSIEPVEIQLRYKLSDGTACDTEISYFKVGRILKDGVI